MRAHLSDFLCSLIGNYWEKEKKTARGHALFRGFIAQMDNIFMHDVQKEKGINLWGFLLFVFAGGWSVTHQLCTERAEICPWCWTKNPLGQIDEEGGISFGSVAWRRKSAAINLGLLVHLSHRAQFSSQTVVVCSMPGCVHVQLSPPTSLWARHCMGPNPLTRLPG